LCEFSTASTSGIDVNPERMIISFSAADDIETIAVEAREIASI